MRPQALPLLGRTVTLAVSAAAFSLVAGCSSYQGTARSVEPAKAAKDGNWWMVSNFPLVRQQKHDDCGAAALASVLRFWGHETSPESITSTVGRKNSRLRAGDMAAYARKNGLRSFVFFGTMADVEYELKRGRPVIVGLGKKIDDKKALSHYEVVVGYEPEQKLVMLLDPGRGWQVDSVEGFAEEWSRSKGVTIVMFAPEGEGEPAPTKQTAKTNAVPPRQ